MNIDDPKLTAFALDELEEPMKSEIARAIAGSPEAQRRVAETREIANALKHGFAAELETKSGAPTNIMDIRDEPWFWSRARPLALAAAIAVLAVLAAITFSTYRPRNDSVATSPTGTNTPEIQVEEPAPVEAASPFSGPERVSNPLKREAIQQIERVVIGELIDPHLQTGEIRVIETINDAYRIQRLKERLATPVLSKKSNPWTATGTYHLIFLDRYNHVVAAARFYRSPDFGFVLQPSKYGSEREKRFFVGDSGGALPGAWEESVDYSNYVIPFSDWPEGIGYSPGA